ncbi:TPA: cupin domain-containing protein [Legionella pneumophila]|nr:cupin domain-containing protein [Legionella pneumophila]HAT8868437.1 cupin domain-containing protein [Legionella pneumophila subsp. pneumophila]HAT8890523.1 cupin domain-containing protein [Legionella pneumophila subsp. pneumophila]HAT8933544.1 cupin domain-containing protein [Legionella pneumophila subsp. pneumophila]HAU0162436.1 cupin domain-containing protein [Legionella pneumophila]
MSVMKKFHSADFDKTPPTIIVELPEKLKHQNVEGNGKNTNYSAERKHPVHFVDLPSHTISITIGSLDPDGRSNRHRHTYETILFVLEGKGYSVIEDTCVEWEKGDAIYIPVWAWHHHVNQDNQKSAKYLACENTPMLQNLGCLAIREESHLAIGNNNNV